MIPVSYFLSEKYHDEKNDEKPAHASPSVLFLRVLFPDLVPLRELTR